MSMIMLNNPLPVGAEKSVQSIQIQNHVTDPWALSDIFLWTEKDPKYKKEKCCGLGFVNVCIGCERKKNEPETCSAVRFKGSYNAIAMSPIYWIYTVLTLLIWSQIWKQILGSVSYILVTVSVALLVARRLKKNLRSRSWMSVQQWLPVTLWYWPTALLPAWLLTWFASV